MLEFANRPPGSRSDAPGSKPALLTSFSRCLARAGWQVRTVLTVGWFATSAMARPGGIASSCSWV